MLFGSEWLQLALQDDMKMDLDKSVVLRDCRMLLLRELLYKAFYYIPVSRFRSLFSFFLASNFISLTVQLDPNHPKIKLFYSIFFSSKELDPLP